jgi:hypothetical protein
MKKLIPFFYYTLIFVCLSLSNRSFSQNVGIGTSNPHSKAILDIKATDKGILFPRLTSAQRNAIVNPPNGLHIFNTDERCLNYYDSAYRVWNCYCSDCQSVIINITDDVCNVDFYSQYAKYSPAKKYIINISEDVYISGCNPGDTALSFRNMPSGTFITINNNNGAILGGGGKGGKGQVEQGTGNCSVVFPVIGEPGQAGGAAIVTKPGVTVTVNNSGVVAGGGGGGGGSTKGATSGYGGGGGGGAGLAFGSGGTGGGVFTQSCSQFGCTPCSPNILAQPGIAGTNLTGGKGGAGYNGGPSGGNGGNRGQPGQNGNTTAGGAAGKAIAGGSGNVINNLNGGQTFGIVD